MTFPSLTSCRLTPCISPFSAWRSTTSFLWPAWKLRLQPSENASSKWHRSACELVGWQVQRAPFASRPCQQRLSRRIAYCNTTQPVAPVMAQIEALRHLPPAEVLITSVALVELRREGRAYWWEVLERVGLGVDG